MKVGERIVHRACTGNAESRSRVLFLRLHGWREPFEEALFEFLWSRADRAAMVGVRNFPGNSVEVTVVDLTGVTNRNVAIDLTVNEEDGNACSGDRIFGRNFIHVKVVLPADV